MSEKKSPLVYVGPDRPFGLPLMRNAILADSPEKVFPAFESFLEKHNFLRRLFVPPSQLAEIQAAMRKPGSTINIRISRIKEASDNYKRENGQGGDA